MVHWCKGQCGDKLLKPQAKDQASEQFVRVEWWAMLIRIYGGQIYEFIGQEEKLDCWRSRCAECGEQFEIKTGVAASLKAFAPNRRCPSHAKSGKRVAWLRVETVI